MQTSGSSMTAQQESALRSWLRLISRQAEPYRSGSAAPISLFQGKGCHSVVTVLTLALVCFLLPKSHSFSWMR